MQYKIIVLYNVCSHPMYNVYGSYAMDALTYIICSYAMVVVEICNFLIAVTASILLLDS